MIMSKPPNDHEEWQSKQDRLAHEKRAAPLAKKPTTTSKKPGDTSEDEHRKKWEKEIYYGE